MLQVVDQSLAVVLLVLEVRLPSRDKVGSTRSEDGSQEQTLERSFAEEDLLYKGHKYKS